MIFLAKKKRIDSKDVGLLCFVEVLGTIIIVIEWERVYSGCSVVVGIYMWSFDCIFPGERKTIFRNKAHIIWKNDGGGAIEFELFSNYAIPSNIGPTFRLVICYREP